MANDGSIPNVTQADVDDDARALQTFLASRAGTLPSINAATPNRAATPAPRAPGAIPSLAAPNVQPISDSGAGIPSVSIPNLAKPTRAESNAASKREYAEGIPSVTAAPFTPEYYRQEQELADYKKQHPAGSAISEHPGLIGKIGHVAANISNVAGDALIPGVMATIPGTQLNERLQQGERMRGFNAAVENEQKEQATEASKAGNEPTQWTPLGSDTPLTVPAKAIPGLLEADSKRQSTEQAALAKNEGALAKAGYQYAADGKTIEPIPDDKLSPEAKQQRGLTAALTNLHEAQTEVEKAKNNPNSPAFALAKERLDQAQQNANRQIEALGLHQQEFQNKVQEQELVKPSGQTVSRSDAAGAALAQLPALEDEIRQNAANMGPLMGRIRKGQIKIGDVDPQTQKLYSTLESFYAQQPAIHGFRNAEFVKDFDTFIGNLQTNPDAVIAGLEGLRPTLEAVEKSGRTYRRREVEGRENKPTASDGGKATDNNVQSFGDWQKSQKKPS